MEFGSDFGGFWMVKLSQTRKKINPKRKIKAKRSKRDLTAICNEFARFQGSQGSVFRPKFVENRSKIKVEIRLSFFSVFLTNLDGFGRHVERQNESKMVSKDSAEIE